MKQNDFLFVLLPILSEDQEEIMGEVLDAYCRIDH